MSTSQTFDPSVRAELKRRIQARISIEDRGYGSPCWISDRAAAGGDGAYTKIGVTIANKPVTWYTHRLAYVLFAGEIRDGKEIDHRCDQPKCCNPDHLALVDHRENLLRSRGFASKERAQRACISGHRFDSTNTYVDRLGRRHCRECRRRRNREHAARRRKGTA